MRNGQVIRVLRLLASLVGSRFGLTISQLRREGYDVQRRTLYRDIAAIEAAGLPVRRERRPGGAVAYRLTRRILRAEPPAQQASG